MGTKRMKRARAPVRAGLTPRQESFVNWSLAALVTCLGFAWTVSVIHAYALHEPGEALPPRPARAVGSSLTDPRAHAAAYLGDAGLGFLDPLRGRSGKLRAVFRAPREPVSEAAHDPALRARYEHEGGNVLSSDDFSAPERPGVYKLAVELGKAKQAIDDLRVVTLVPFREKKDDRIGLYYLGRWPYEKGGTPRSRAYANPSGFVEVTRANKDTPVSEHFRLGDFLTKDQFDVWPKYVVIDPRLLDKLELVAQELEKHGHDVAHMQVMSGFRTPRYNRAGGNTGGRASLSRHMYGDAADVFVDNDRDGTMDDLTGDGRVDTADAEVIGKAAERVEAAHPALVGGVGIYKACCGHGPFTHVDVRGYRARWRGEGAG
jgi:uncharacterized protein YcbK (DUF882 family)